MAAILVVFVVSPGQAQVAAQYPPLSEYLMPRDAEVALARSAAPSNISGRATIRVLTESGYQVAREGHNGFVCMVMRGWTAPTYTPAQFRDLVYDATLRAPICFDPAASRTVLPYYELRSTLGMQGKTPDQIAGKAFRQPMPEASCRSGTASRSHTCGPRISISDRASTIGILT